jgi:hypothetical protein
MRARSFVWGLFLLFVVGAGWRAAAAGDDGDDNSADRSRIARGFAIAPVPLDLHRKNRALVGLGSYLVNAGGGCNDCHTYPSYTHAGNPFAGAPKQVNQAHYLAGGAPFGPFRSRNLTDVTDEHSFDEFLQIMRHGRDFDNAHPQISPLLQVMPWPVYQDLTTRDLRAIYEYLSAIPAANPCVVVGPQAPDPTCVP